MRVIVSIAVLCVLLFALVFAPGTPLPGHWNPSQPLTISAPVTPVTKLQLRRAMRSADSCRATLAQVADFTPFADREYNAQCHIRMGVALTSLAGVAIRATDTRCDLALRTAMWVTHGIAPAAQRHFDQTVSAMRTQGSFNCRNIAGSSRPSTHSQAKALDVAGFTLRDGTKIELIDDWDGAGAKSAFLRDVRDSACTWYATTLGPEFNRAHADHFHLQSEGWGTCR